MSTKMYNGKNYLEFSDILKLVITNCIGENHSSQDGNWRTQ